MGANSKSIPRWVFILAAVLWVATNLRSVSTMCFDWDAAQLSLATYDRLPSNKLTRALQVATPFAVVSAARANGALRDQVELLQPSRIICLSQFQDASPNRRSVEYDFRHFTGNGGPSI